MKKFEKKPLSIEQVIGFLKEHFNLEEFLRTLGESTDAADIRQNFTFIGHDGPRRVPLRTDDNLVSFLRGLQNTDLPSVEAQFSQQGKKRNDRENFQAGRAKDNLEKLEDENKRLLLRWEKTERRIDDFERQRTKDFEETQKFVKAAVMEMKQQQAESLKRVGEQISLLQQEDSAIRKDFSDEQAATQAFKQQVEVQHGSLSQHLEMLGHQITNVRDDFLREFKTIKEKQQRMVDEDARLNQEIVGHTRQLTIMEQSKVDVVAFEENNRKMDDRMTADYASLNRRLDESETQLSMRLVQTHTELKNADAALSDELHREVDGMNQGLNRLEEELRNLEEFQIKKLDGLQTALDQAHAELKDMIVKTDASSRHDFQNQLATLQEELKERIDSTDRDLMQKDNAIHRRVDDTNTKFEDLNAEKDARIAALDKAVGDTAARLRAELRSEAERLRLSLDQEVARLDEEVDAGHKKHDITKAELNFCQQRVTEQREWSQKLFAERESATEAVQVEAVEGLKALNRMLHALKDDEVAFREKMANHIKSLQGDTQSHGEQISEHEQQRKRMRLDLDGLAEDYHEYVGDMDGWSGDVRRKVEKLFRSMEPTKVEWRVEKISQKRQKVVKPMTIRSPAFNISGLKEIRFDWYPNGHYSSPENCGVLRIYAPAGTSIKYQCWCGHLTGGALEWQNGKDALWTDVIFENWENEIKHGDYIVLEFEVLANNQEGGDEVLGKTLRIDTP